MRAGMLRRVDGVAHEIIVGQASRDRLAKHGQDGVALKMPPPERIAEMAMREARRARRVELFRRRRGVQMPGASVRAERFGQRCEEAEAARLRHVPEEPFLFRRHDAVFASAFRTAIGGTARS